MRNMIDFTAEREKLKKPTHSNLRNVDSWFSIQAHPSNLFPYQYGEHTLSFNVPAIARDIKEYCSEYPEGLEILYEKWLNHPTIRENELEEEIDRILVGCMLTKDINRDQYKRAQSALAEYRQLADVPDSSFNRELRVYRFQPRVQS